jgi:hypothetical protein
MNPVPVGKHRMVGPGSPSGQQMHEQGDLIGNLTSTVPPIEAGPATSVDFNVVLIDANGVEYIVQSGTVTDSESFGLLAGLSGLLMKEGESLRLDNTSTDVDASIEGFAAFMDVQGPIESPRVVLTDEYQDIIPPPGNGKVHVPLFYSSGEGGSVFAYGGIYAPDLTGGAVEYRINPLADTFTSLELADSVGPGSQTPGLPGSRISQVVLKEGQSFQARLHSSSPSLQGVTSFLSYLVMDNNDDTP